MSTQGESYMLITFKRFHGHNALMKLFLVSLLLVAGGCASADKTYDPLEPVNRQVQKFNDTVDTYALKPVARGYGYVFPEFFRVALRNAFDNISYPTVFINQFLQGKWETGFADMTRFVCNSTVGIAGLIDVATEMGLPAHDEDFGQTFAVWGMSGGPYLVLPIMGPLTLRDGIGLGAGWFTYLPNYIDDDDVYWSIVAARTVVARERLLQKEKMITGDRYLFIRDAYLQRRNHLIEDGRDTADPFLND